MTAPAAPTGPTRSTSATSAATMADAEVIVTVRMPAELRDRLSAIAGRQERSLAACIRFFLTADVLRWERSRAYFDKQREKT